MSIAVRGAYYCEVCRTGVDWNAKNCPHCGVTFSGVLCPRCRKLGSSQEFLDGCPKCGNLREWNLVGKTMNQTAALQEGDRHGKGRRPWSSTLYWFLSFSLIVLIGFIMSYWMKS